MSEDATGASRPTLSLVACGVNRMRAMPFIGIWPHYLGESPVIRARLGRALLIDSIMSTFEQIQSGNCFIFPYPKWKVITLGP